MQNHKKYWLRSGLLIATIFLVAAIFWWVFVSVNIGCILEPMQSINLGGPECLFNNYVSIWSLIYFGLPTLFGFVFGMIFGGIFGLIKRLRTR